MEKKLGIPVNRFEDEITKKLKLSFDPHNILNPGVFVGVNHDA
jgi:FAD/FMN-containing dehydrogenase